MSKRAHILLPWSVAALVLLFCGSQVVRGAGPETGKTSKDGYHLPFGADQPYLPSQAKAAFTGFLNPQDIPPAAYCGKCHEQAYHDWRESAHGNSFRPPFYLKNVQILIDQKGIEYTRHCEGCHNPMALFTGALTTGSRVERPFDEEGITCMVCHSIQRIQNTQGIGSYVMGTPAAMVKEDGTPVPGQPPFDEIFARPDLHKRAVMRDFYRTAEFCGACHKAAVPKQLNGYKWLRAFAVYDEWQQSSWSKESPLPYYKKDTVSTCQTCHMKPVEVAGKDYPARDGKMASHRFLGANTAIPTLYGFKDQLDKTVAFLKDENVGIDLFGMNKAAPQDQTFYAPLERRDFTVLNGDQIVFSVLVQNKKIGHSLVPEQRDFYESWLEFEAKDADGRSLYHSGYVAKDGTLDPRAHSYTNRLLGKNANWLTQHQVWETRIRGFDNSILPGRTDLARFQVLVPPGAKSPVTVTARVNYRRFRRSYTDFIFGHPFELPTVVMAEKSFTFNLGANKGRPAGAPKDDLLRWNNYGVALTDQQQYDKAVLAFEQVLKLDPGYLEANTNIAVALNTNGHWAEAQTWLRKVLEKDPGNWRARAYQGIVYRMQYQLDQAIDTLEPVVKQYPRMRQAQTELAYAYFLKKNFAKAAEHYEAVLAVDPDDLSALRYLPAAYRALGRKKEADELTALFVERLDDPSVNFLVQEFWKSNPWMANESSPFHVHADYTAEQLRAIQRTLRPTVLWPGDR